MVKKILLLPGDGIGPEISRELEKVLNWFGERQALDYNLEHGAVGGASYDAFGVPLTDEVIEKALQADAIFFGAVGGSKWDNVPYELRPEAALLGLRSRLGLFSNLRPAICYKALVDFSSLRPELVEDLDIVIVRELTGGVYFGEPKEIVTLDNGKRRAIDSQIYHEDEIVRIARIAFEMARTRRNSVASAEKHNVMRTGLLWRDVVTSVHREEYPDVELTHILADNCAMQLVRRPKQFDVILTDNLFGDILSDVAAMLTGSLGMLPSASLGARDENGKQCALYEPVHGSAPDIAGQNAANPLAMILSFAMGLRYSFGMIAEADFLERTVGQMLDQGIGTKDLFDASNGHTCSEVGDLLVDALDKGWRESNGFEAQ